MAESDERRRGERIPINDEFSRSGGAGSTWVSDLSHGGVFVHTEELLPVGSMIELRFTILIDDPVVIEAFGKVVRHSHKPRGMGVEFAAMRPEMTLRIEDVLARRRPLDSGAPLRLPEPSSVKPAPVEELVETDTTNRVLFARPAPVEGLGLRRVPKQEFEDAVTASFPRVESQREPKATVFKAPPRPPSKPQPEARPRQTKDEDRTAVYQAVRRKDE